MPYGLTLTPRRRHADNHPFTGRDIRVTTSFFSPVTLLPRQALVIRRGHKRSIIAIAHKLLRTMFFMLKRGEHYRDSATDYEALSVKRNAPRWIKALTKFGFIPNPA